jgi:hypothetical protein
MRFTRFETVSFERPDESDSEDDDELSSELEESNQATAGPGVDSASMSSCGVDSYM